MKLNLAFTKGTSITFFFLLMSLAIQAQTVLTGKVTNQNLEPLSGATVFIKELNKTTITDLDGLFEIRLKEGSYTLQASYIGYSSVTKQANSSKNNLTFVLKDQTHQLDEVLVSAVRVQENSPVTHSNLNKEEIAKRNLGQDIPILMNYMPSVVTTSDAGAGIGYTGIRVRGSDASRTNVTINGIPYNDSESQGVYWVNVNDIASSTQSIQLQRGVGTSTNGAGAFGASLNLLTDNGATQAFGEVSTSAGSFNTKKITAKLGTGLLNNHINLIGRVSKTTSDGYVDRASSDLTSYFLQGSYKNDNTLIKALIFGGHEITYQSWNGVDAATLASDRTFNSAGAKYDNTWNVTGYYDNEVDDYEQDHLQLHWNQKYNNHFSSNIALHYTFGRGFYEQYKQGADFSDYNLTPITIESTTINTTDLVRRKWLSNDFYGVTYNLNYKTKQLDFLIGGALNKYEGDHFGEVVWARNASDSEIRNRYYDNYGNKTDGNIYAKATYKLNNQLSLFGDLQYRVVNYEANGVQTNLVDDTFKFLNPKAGITYLVNTSNSVYASYARANKEPNRTDYENGNPKPEQLDDFELGWRYKTNKSKINTNIYYMFYTDQLTLTGQVDNIGSPIRANSGESYRLGLEVDASFYINKYVTISPNVTFSQNKNVDYKETDGTTITDLGNTEISYSPSIVAGNMITVTPIDQLYISLLSKFVDTQYMSNTELKASKLKSYFVSDLNLNYSFYPKSTFKEITLTGLVNNIFNKEYVSNGYMWGTTPYYFPQAGTNFLVGATFKL